MEMSQYSPHEEEECTRSLELQQTCSELLHWIYWPQLQLYKFSVQLCGEKDFCTNFKTCAFLHLQKMIKMLSIAS